MKVKDLISLFSLLAVFLFAACSDDDDKCCSYVDLSKQVLTLTEGEATTSTFTFSVKASDATIPYLCLYVDKNVVDNVAKGELPNYLMNELKKEAESKGTPFEQYVASLTYTGDQSNLKIDNLLPGRIYELVVFAVDGTRTADKAEYLFFQTMKTEHIDCTFDVVVVPEMLDAQSAVFDIKPSDKNVNGTSRASRSPATTAPSVVAITTTKASSSRCWNKNCNPFLFSWFPKADS